MKNTILVLCALATASAAMAQKDKQKSEKNAAIWKGYPVARQLATYKTLPLKTDISSLSEAEKETLRHLIHAAKTADDIFWMQAWGDKNVLLSDAKNDTVRRFMELNYGPWDRLNDNGPFVKGVGDKPKGANFYPKDITREEWNNWDHLDKNNPYTIVQRDVRGNLVMVPYHLAYEEKIREMVKHLSLAANAIRPEDEQFAGFLEERCNALSQSDYNKSDIAWLGLLKNRLDIIIGPIENYEDEFQGARTAFESYVLIRDMAWTGKLERYVSLLPSLQQSLPVAAAYKPALAMNSTQPVVPDGNAGVQAIEVSPAVSAQAARPGSSLAVFDVVYYAGHNNAGSKTIAVNLPNDETLQQEYGTRRSQLKNVMQAKFDNMVKPIANLMLSEAQAAKVNFDAFFNNVMFHEVAHGLGVKNTVNGKGTVREALGAGFSPIEECKADVLGLYMITRLLESGDLEGNVEDFYITFVAGTFRSVRFGAASAHGKANMIIFNTLVSKGAIIRQKDGKYTVKVQDMKKVISSLAAELLTLQGDGNMQGVANMLDTRAVISDTLKADLSAIEKAGIPVDLIFEQGADVLGLDK
ncbi:MAG: dipeptidyl-peptidase 3 family protein [Sphingomonadales bacterium]